MLGKNPKDYLQEESVISFIDKTWLFWWMLAAFAILRWFHLLSVRSKMNSNAPAEEEDHSVSDWWLQRSQMISLPETKGTHPA